MFYRNGFIADRSFTFTRIGNFDLFAPVTLTLTIYELYPYPLDIYRICENKLSTQ